MGKHKILARVRAHHRSDGTRNCCTRSLGRSYIRSRRLGRCHGGKFLEGEIRKAANPGGPLLGLLIRVGSRTVNKPQGKERVRTFCAFECAAVFVVENVQTPSNHPFSGDAWASLLRSSHDSRPMATPMPRLACRRNSACSNFSLPDHEMWRLDCREFRFLIWSIRALSCPVGSFA